MADSASPTVELLVQGWTLNTNEGRLGFCGVTLIEVGGRRILVDVARDGASVAQSVQEAVRVALGIRVEVVPARARQPVTSNTHGRWACASLHRRASSERNSSVTCGWSPAQAQEPSSSASAVAGRSSPSVPSQDTSAARRSRRASSSGASRISPLGKSW